MIWNEKSSSIIPMRNGFFEKKNLVYEKLYYIIFKKSKDIYILRLKNKRIVC